MNILFFFRYEITLDFLSIQLILKEISYGVKKKKWRMYKIFSSNFGNWKDFI